MTPPGGLAAQPIFIGFRQGDAMEGLLAAALQEYPADSIMLQL